MLENVIEDQSLNKYLTSFDPGQTILVEGDDSRDMYILVSGQLDVLKGSKKIWEITDRGSIFGEMSFLLRSKRTATVKTRTEVQVLCIPKTDINGFLGEFPQVAVEITRLLASRLGEATQIVYGFREFCDQLPDAVLLADKGGHIFSWNTAAENLYGRDAKQMRQGTVEDIYEEPQAYKNFLDEVQQRYSVREKILKVKHPEKGLRFVSTSTTVLYDGHHNFKGVLSLGRDVTDVQNLERRYRRVRNWFIPVLVFFVLAGAAMFSGYRHFSKGYQTLDEIKQGLRNQLAKDYVLLKSMLTDHFANGNKFLTSQLMKEFFRIQDTSVMPYTGLVLLDKDKKVFDSYSVKTPLDGKDMDGNSYGGIAFKGDEKTIHKVLSLYRVDEDHPMGSKGVEIAFEMYKRARFLGWLVFQMDVESLDNKYGLDEKGLEAFRFKMPQEKDRN